MKLTTFTDGGSRSNPGPAASGIVIKDETGKTINAFGVYLGTQTNNYAEYMALIEALKKAKELGGTEVECVMDSLLVCNQMKGMWKVKEVTLQKLCIQAHNASRAFRKVTYRHVLRAFNKEADAEVNKILDNQTAL